MATLSLIELQKTTTDPVMSGILEAIVTVDQLVGAIPMVGIGSSDHIIFNREKALPSVSRPSSGATITADNSLEFDRVTTFVRRILVDQDADVLDSGVVGGMNQARAVALAMAGKAIGRAFGSDLINGSSNLTCTVNSTGVAGMTVSAITVGPGHDPRMPVGTIRYTHSGTTLQYKAPGDAEFGAAVTAASGAKLYSDNPNLWCTIAYSGTLTASGDVNFTLSYTSSAVSVDGLARLVPASQTISSSTNGDAITLATLDQLADLVTNADGPKVYVMPTRTRRAVAALLRAAGGATMSEYTNAIFPSGPRGQSYLTYNGIPIICTDWISIAQTQGSASTATAVYCATLGERAGLCGLFSNAAVDPAEASSVISSAMGLTALDVGTVQNADARRTRVKAYWGVKCGTEKGVAAATGILS
jgi:hypothetical protein